MLQPMFERSIVSPSTALKYASRSEPEPLSLQFVTGIAPRTTGGSEIASARSVRAVAEEAMQLASAIESAATSGRREHMRCERSMVLPQVIPEGEERWNVCDCDIAKNEADAAPAKGRRERPLRAQ